MNGDHAPAPDGQTPPGTVPGADLSADSGLPDDGGPAEDGGLAASALGAALADFGQAAQKLAAAAQECGWVASAVASREAVRSVVGSLAAGEAAYLTLLRGLDRREDAVPGARAGFGALTFLTVALHRSRGQAGRDVKAARALDPAAGMPDEDLYADGETHAPALGTVFAAGLVTREHVDVGVRALAELPKGLLRRVDPDGVTVGAKADAYLAKQAQGMDPDTFRHVCTQLRAYLDPDRERFDAEAHERRYLAMRMTDDGMVLLRGQLPGAEAAVVKAALDAASTPQPAAEVLDEHGQATLVRDDRTTGQRYADGLVGICRHWNGCDTDDTRGQTHVMLVADLDQLTAARTARAGRSGGRGAVGGGAAAQDTTAAGLAARGGGAFAGHGGLGVGRAHCLQTGPVTTLTLQALACDAVLQSVLLDRSGAVLSLGRTVRTVTAAQRRALIARDRGCVIPGCHAPPEVCEAHHARWWRHGGTTDVENLALLCGRHHSEVHAGIWTLEMIDGVPYGIPPRWARSDQPRLRNTVHHTDVLARHFATQLVIDLTEPVGADPPERAVPDTG